MKDIMSRCNFTAEEYEPAKDSVVANVRVRSSAGRAALAAPAGVVLAGAVLSVLL